MHGFIRFSDTVPWWLIVAASLAATILLVYQFRFLRQQLPLGRTLVLTLLRAAVFALLILFLLGPASISEESTRLRRPIVVLVDTSKSMKLGAGSGDASRLDRVKEVLSPTSLGGILEKQDDVRAYEFGSTMKPLNLGAVSEVAARGDQTLLFEALEEAAKNEKDAVGVVLLTDGITDHKKLQDLAYPKPLLIIGVGETKDFVDLAIKDLQAPALAFRGREMKIDFTVQAHGMAGANVPLYFNLGNSLISTNTINIDRDPYEEQWSLSYTPKDIGPHSFTLTLPDQTNEAIRQNNKKEFRADVRRDKLRVLTLSGAPSWNYRFLRLALKQDPYIDLVSFVFLRTPDDIVDVPERQLSLIPFPIDEIFLEELKNFDLLILDDFSYRSYFNALYLENLRDFVRNGGGLAMLGGVRSFDSGGYWDSPLSEILPVKLTGDGKYERNTSVRATLTAAGKEHPLTRILADPKSNEDAWTSLPALRTINNVSQAKGEVLLSAMHGGRELPLLAVGRFGKGRTLAFLSDDLWRWNFDAVGNKQNPQIHLKLIRHGVRWLAKEPSFDQVQIVSISGSRRPQEKLGFRVRTFNDDFTPAQDARVTLTVVAPGGQRFRVEAQSMEEAGEYRGEFVPAREGSYRLEAEAEAREKTLGTAKKDVLVVRPSSENEDGRPRHEFLQALASRSKGLFVRDTEWSPSRWREFEEHAEKVLPSTIAARSRIDLANSPLIFLLALLLLGLEWWLRRTWGFV